MIPYKNRLTITAQEKGTLQLFSLNGRLISSQKISEGNHSVRLRQARGIYVVRLVHNLYNVTEKIRIE